jgi:hypothetical protein
MKKLKKGLSLLLVLAMVFSLATTAFAGWDVSGYGDADQITQDEAVAVMTGLGVIEGDDTTGLFQPTGTYTREAAAKVLTYMLLGPTAASKLTATTDPFDDVPADRWSAGCIAYLANEGIIEGYGDGNFGPQKELTQAAWLKMLLCAMGYDADKTGMGNTANWAAKAQSLAVKSTLLAGKDLALDWDRETAVYYAFKAVSTNENLADSTDKTLPFIVEVGTYANNTTDDLGRPTASYTADGADKAYATATADPVAVYENQTVKVADLKKAVDKDGTSWGYVLNGYTGASLGDNVGGYGSVVEVYKIADKSYKIVQIDTFAEKVTAVTPASGDNARTITVGGKTFETEDFEKDDVVLYTAETKNGTAADKILSVEAADTIEGAITATGTGYVKVDGEKMNVAAKVVTSYVPEADKTVTKTIYLDTYGNVVYDKAVSAPAETAKTYAYVIDRVSTAYVAGTTFTAAKAATAQAQIVDLATGEIKVVNESIELNAAGTNYVYTGTAAVSGVDNVVKTVGSDGTDNIAGSGSVVSNSQVGEGTIMEYTVKEDGSYELKTSANLQSSTTAIAAKAAKVDGVTDAVATSATKLTVVTYDASGAKTKVETYTGIANFPASTSRTASKSVVEKKDGKITNIYVVQTSSISGDTNVNYAVYIGNQETDGTVYNNDFVVDGEVVTYAFASEQSLVKGNAYNVTVDSAGKATARVLRAVSGDTIDQTNDACTVFINGKVTVLDDTFVVVKISNVDYTVYFADSYKVVDGTYDSAAGETVADASYKATSLEVGQTVTIYADAAKSVPGKAAFIIVNEAASEE